MLSSGTLAVGYIKYIKADLFNRDVKNAMILWWIMQRLVFLSPRYEMSVEGRVFWNVVSLYFTVPFCYNAILPHMHRDV